MRYLSSGLVLGQGVGVVQCVIYRCQPEMLPDIANLLFKRTNDFFRLVGHDWQHPIVEFPRLKNLGLSTSKSVSREVREGECFGGVSAALATQLVVVGLSLGYESCLAAPCTEYPYSSQRL